MFKSYVGRLKYSLKRDWQCLLIYCNPHYALFVSGIGECYVEEIIIVAALWNTSVDTTTTFGFGLNMPSYTHLLFYDVFQVWMNGP